MKKYSHFLLFVLLAAGCAAGNETVRREISFADQGVEALRQGRYGDAELHLIKALIENPDDPCALLNLGVVYQNTGRPKEAKIAYNKVIRMNPSEVVVKSDNGQRAGKSLADIAKENLRHF